MKRSDITEEPSWFGTLKEYDKESITDEHGTLFLSDGVNVDLPIGATVEYWGKGFGYTIRGAAVDGHVLYYRTATEQKAKDEADKQIREDKKRAEFEHNRSKLDADYNSLPETFKARIDRFRNGNPDFRWEYESYEMMCCTEALKIAKYCSINRIADDEEPTAAENILAYRNLPYEDQEKAGISDGHSGNSLGMAIRLAYLWVTDPGFVEFEHGALTMLVGCEDYGCTHD
jgi:hypothetical protein